MRIGADKCFEDEQWEGISCPDVSGSTFNGCTFISVDLSEAVARNSSFENCTFVGCDLSRFSVLNASFNDVNFKDCRMFGVDWSKVSPLVFSINIKDSNSSYSGFEGLALSGCVFEEINFTDVSFNGCNLKGVRFTECDMAGASFSRAILRDVDLSTSSNVFLDHRESTLYDTRISVTDALSVLQSQGIIISINQRDL